MQLKIEQIIRRFVFSEWGGTETVVWNTSKQLSRLGYDNEILATAALDRVGEESVDGMNIKRFPYYYPYLN